MTKRIDPNVATTRTVGVRLTPEQLVQLDEEVALSNASAVGAQASQASVARALLVEALQARALARSAKPTHTKAPAGASILQPLQDAAPRSPAAPPTPAPAAAPATLTFEQAVIAALKANEKPGTDLLDVAAVVRSLEADWHPTAIHAELVRLGTAGVDVLELRPDSGNGNERSEDRAIVPKGLDGTPLLTARWKNRPEAVPSSDGDSDALRARLKAHRVAAGKTERQVADACGIQKDRMNRWTNGTKKTLSPDDEKKLVAYLDSVGA